MTPPRPNKRRKIETQIATFLDIEAGVEADGDVSEEEGEYDQDENIFSHTLLSREYDGAGDIDWDTFLDRARRRGRNGVLTMNAEGPREGPRDSDGLYEIMCQVGTEETAVFRVLQAAVDPALVIYSAFARKSLPGRIFAEVLSLDAAQALAKKVSYLSPHNIRQIPQERMTEMLELGGNTSDTSGTLPLL
ncbi:hypothetical protein GALMADRAFT_1147848 [Galerina marginata CBS 339.88]|uniref:NGN domain-containing protein n=1 Tax=Galerina marginata (strain CBS 339.88) TaxID=685588 RepID=A0A067SIM6_GALM3|nr:hypothetical protein GALMADRAFT_1147848 [Galerina marginata CBS 339.88]